MTDSESDLMFLNQLCIVLVCVALQEHTDKSLYWQIVCTDNFLSFKTGDVNGMIMKFCVFMPIQFILFVKKANGWTWREGS